MKNTAYRTYLLLLLMVILAFNYVDRFALGLLLQDIKTDLSLSDTELGMLSGIAFALFYSVMGLPIARWADRGNRVIVITATTMLWSIAVALCGQATSFVQLLAIRMVVAVGEAGCIPPAHSLIGDYFTRAERPQALAIYMIGGPLSVVIGFLVAGWLNEMYGWRTTFMLLAVPGPVLGVLAYMTLIEPRRKVLSKKADGSTRSISETHLPRGDSTNESPSLISVYRTLWANITFRHLLFSIAVVYFFGYGIWQWIPAFFMRSYQMKTGELGTWLGSIWGVGGIIGTYCGGAIASRLAAHNERRQLKAMAWVYATFAVVPTFIYLSSDLYVGLGLMALTVIGVSMTTGPLFATIQSLVDERMRAMSIGIIYLFANLLGMGLGPLATGALSDALRPWAGEESLRYALLLLCPGYFWGSWHLWRASRTVMRDLSVVLDHRNGELIELDGSTAQSH